MKLDQTTIKHLKYCVYLLINPMTNKPFYVGKGHSNRINDHEILALEHELEQRQEHIFYRQSYKHSL